MGMEILLFQLDFRNRTGVLLTAFLTSMNFLASLNGRD